MTKTDNSKFSATVDAWARESEARLLAVYRFALSDMVNDMQVSRAKGGRMRVDTGFLRASGVAALNTIPSGNGQRPADAPVGQYTGVYDTWDGQQLEAVLSEMNLGDTFYFGWVANYADVREVYDGFMDIPLQNWQGYVNSAVRRAQKEVARNAGRS